MKTFAFMKTHFIDDSVISEYKKFSSARETDTILFIDNHTNIIKSSNENGFCYMQTTNIDGETNLKPIEAIKKTNEI